MIQVMRTLVFVIATGAFTVLPNTITAARPSNSFTGCNPEYFGSQDAQSVAECGMLYQQLEASLLDPLNLYKLRRVMFPNKRVQPLVVMISYTISLHSSSQIEPCSGGRVNNSLIREPRYQKNATWTSSTTLSVIDPRDFDFLLPSVLTLLNPIVRDYSAEYNPNYASLFLHINNTCIPHQDQIDDIIEDLTTKAKSYAANTDPELKLDSWDSEYNGYFVGDHSHLEFLFVFGPAVAAVIVLMTAFVPIVYKELFHKKLKPKIRKKEKPFVAIYRSLNGIVLIINLFYYLSEIIGFALLSYYQDSGKIDNNQRYAIISRFSGLILSLLFATGVAYIIVIWSRLFDVEGRYYPSVCCFMKSNCGDIHITRVEAEAKDDDINRHLNSQLCCVFSCLKFSCKCTKKCFKNRVILLNYLAFLVILAWSVVPIITLLFIDPVLTLAIVSFLLVFFILVTILLSLLIIYRERETVNKRYTRYSICSKSGEIKGSFIAKCCSYTCCQDGFLIGLVSVVLFLFGTGILLTTYAMITSRNTSSSGGDIVGFVVAFIPTIITAVAAWLGKRALFPKGEEKEDNDGTGNGIHNTDLELNDFQKELVEGTRKNFSCHKKSSGSDDIDFTGPKS